MMRYLPLAVFVSIAALLFMALGQDHTPKSAWEGRPLPALSATKLGKNEAMPIPAEGDIYMINLFASWCTPCLAEHPLLTQLAETHNLPIIGVAWNDTEKDVRAFLKEHGNPYRSVYFDTEGDVAIALGIRGVPETFLIGSDGRVLYHIAGPLTQQQMTSDILPLLERAR